jgi:methionyl-tRNA synthetase
VLIAYKYWEGRVPSPGELRPADRQVLATVDEGLQTVGKHLEAVRLRAALTEAIRLASEVNKYLDQSAPWFEIKSDKTAAATTIYTALQAIDSLKVLLAPFLPFTSERLHTYLGYTQPLFGEQFVESCSDSLGAHKVLRYRQGNASGRWESSQLSPGQALVQPAPLFQKLDEGIVAFERSRLGD